MLIKAFTYSVHGPSIQENNQRMKESIELELAFSL